MTHTISLTDLGNKSFVRFFTDGNTLDFLNELIKLSVIDLKSNNTLDTFDVEQFVVNSEQSQTNVFEYSIPKNVDSLEFIFKSNSSPVNLIVAKVF
jgi:TolB-like protein